MSSYLARVHSSTAQFMGSTGLEQELQAVKQKITDAFTKKDTAAIAALYTEDCRVMPPRTDVMIGRQGNNKFMSHDPGPCR